MTTIPDHLIDKAARAVQKERAYRAAAAFGVPEDAHTSCAAMIARAVLEAVADDLRAEAWDEGRRAEADASHHTNWPEEYRDKVRTNPYKETDR